MVDGSTGHNLRSCLVDRTDKPWRRTDAKKRNYWPRRMGPFLWRPGTADGPTAWLQGKTTLARKAANGWKRPFNDPIPLPRGSRLVTLEDAGKYITKLGEAEHEAAEWRAAMEALILVATSPTMFARIGVMRALNRGHVREFNPSRKDTHWGRRKLKRDE